MRLLTSGFSHIGSYAAVLEGLPSNLKIDIDFVNHELKRRQKALGRSVRMDIEDDKILFLSGLIDGVTVGAPLSFIIESKEKTRVSFSAIRPSHADYPSAIKYGFSDLSFGAERASARETVNIVAVGAISKLLLNKLDIIISSKVLSVGTTFNESEFESEIEKARKDGDTLGGTVEVKVSNVPAGFGSLSQYDAKLDGLFAHSLMSLPSVKAVEIGLGAAFGGMRGSKAADILTKKGRLTNHSGGIDGGITNGSDIVLSFTVKPIPTLVNPLDTIDTITKRETKTPVLRADITSVFAAAVAAEGAVAFTLLDAILSSLGGDTVEEVSERFLKKRSKDFLKNL